MRLLTVSFDFEGGSRRKSRFVRWRFGQNGDNNRHGIGSLATDADDFTILCGATHKPD